METNQTTVITYAPTPILDVKNFLGTDFNSLSDSDKIGKIIKAFEKLKVTPVSGADDEMFKFDKKLWSSFVNLKINCVGIKNETSDRIKSLGGKDGSFNFFLSVNMLKEKGANATSYLSYMLDIYNDVNLELEDKVPVDVNVQQYNNAIDGYVGALQAKKAEIDKPVVPDSDSKAEIDKPVVPINPNPKVISITPVSNTEPSFTSFTKLSFLRKTGLMIMMLAPLFLFVALVCACTAIGLSFVKEIKFLKIINDEVMSMHESLSNSYSEGLAIGTEVVAPVLLLILTIVLFILIKTIINVQDNFLDVKNNIAIVEAQAKPAINSELNPADVDSPSSAPVSDVLVTSETSTVVNNVAEKQSETKFKLSIPERIMNFVYLSSDSKEVMKNLG